jgi:hypothetical protein
MQPMPIPATPKLTSVSDYGVSVMLAWAPRSTNWKMLPTETTIGPCRLSLKNSLRHSRRDRGWDAVVSYAMFKHFSLEIEVASNALLAGTNGPELKHQHANIALGSGPLCSVSSLCTLYGAGGPRFWRQGLTESLISGAESTVGIYRSPRRETREQARHFNPALPCCGSSLSLRRIGLASMTQDLQGTGACSIWVSGAEKRLVVQIDLTAVARQSETKASSTACTLTC